MNLNNLKTFFTKKPHILAYYLIFLFITVSEGIWNLFIFSIFPPPQQKNSLNSPPLKNNNFQDEQNNTLTIRPNPNHHHPNLRPKEEKRQN